MSLLLLYLFFFFFSLTPLIILLLNTLYMVEDASVLLQFLLSVDSWRSKSSSMTVGHDKSFIRMEFNSLICIFSSHVLFHEVKEYLIWETLWQWKWGQEIILVGWTCQQSVHKKEKIVNTLASLKLLLTWMCLIYLEIFKAGTSFTYLYFKAALYQLSKDIFSSESPRWKGWLPFLGTFL